LDYLIAIVFTTNSDVLLYRQIFFVLGGQMKLLWRLIFAVSMLAVVVFLALGSSVEVSFLGKQDIGVSQPQRFYFTSIGGGYKFVAQPWDMSDSFYIWTELQRVNDGGSWYYSGPDLCIDCQFAMKLAGPGKKPAITDVGLIQDGHANFIHLRNPIPLQPGLAYAFGVNKGLGSLNFKAMADGKVYGLKAIAQF
jgi:hypothetical protein